MHEHDTITGNPVLIGPRQLFSLRTLGRGRQTSDVKAAVPSQALSESPVRVSMNAVEGLVFVIQSMAGAGSLQTVDERHDGCVTCFVVSRQQRPVVTVRSDSFV